MGEWREWANGGSGCMERVGAWREWVHGGSEGMERVGEKIKKCEMQQVKVRGSESEKKV